jgi:hypothetical protein
LRRRPIPISFSPFHPFTLSPYPLRTGSLLGPRSVKVWSHRYHPPSHETQFEFDPMVIIPKRHSDHLLGSQWVCSRFPIRLPILPIRFPRPCPRPSPCSWPLLSPFPFPDSPLLQVRQTLAVANDQQPNDKRPTTNDQRARLTSLYPSLSTPIPSQTHISAAPLLARVDR